jgi:hypothetical protein
MLCYAVFYSCIVLRNIIFAAMMSIHSITNFLPSLCFTPSGVKIWYIDQLIPPYTAASLISWTNFLTVENWPLSYASSGLCRRTSKSVLRWVLPGDRNFQEWIGLSIFFTVVLWQYHSSFPASGPTSNNCNLCLWPVYVTLALLVIGLPYELTLECWNDIVYINALTLQLGNLVSQENYFQLDIYSLSSDDSMAGLSWNFTAAGHLSPLVIIHSK